jgi:hypothetical protein
MDVHNTSSPNTIEKKKHFGLVYGPLHLAEIARIWKEYHTGDDYGWCAAWDVYGYYRCMVIGASEAMNGGPSCSDLWWRDWTAYFKHLYLRQGVQVVEYLRWTRGDWGIDYEESTDPWAKQNMRGVAPFDPNLAKKTVCDFCEKINWNEDDDVYGACGTNRQENYCSGRDRRMSEDGGAAAAATLFP